MTHETRNTLGTYTPVTDQAAVRDLLDDYVIRAEIGVDSADETSHDDPTVYVNDDSCEFEVLEKGPYEESGEHVTVTLDFLERLQQYLIEEFVIYNHITSTTKARHSANVTVVPPDPEKPIKHMSVSPDGVHREVHNTPE